MMTNLYEMYYDWYIFFFHDSYVQWFSPIDFIHWNVSFFSQKVKLSMSKCSSLCVLWLIYIYILFMIDLYSVIHLYFVYETAILIDTYFSFRIYMFSDTYISYIFSQYVNLNMSHWKCVLRLSWLMHVFHSWLMCSVVFTYI
jgi:hypothetical protein